MTCTLEFQTKNLVSIKNWKTSRVWVQALVIMKNLETLERWVIPNILCLVGEKTMFLSKDKDGELVCLLVVNMTRMIKVQRKMVPLILYKKVEEMGSLQYTKILQEQVLIIQMHRWRLWRQLQHLGVWEIANVLNSSTMFHQLLVLVLMRWGKNLVWTCLVIQSNYDHLISWIKVQALVLTSPRSQPSSRLRQYFL